MRKRTTPAPTPADPAPGRRRPDETAVEPDQDNVGFTPEQWTWLKAQSRDEDYVPTRTLIPGL